MAVSYTLSAEVRNETGKEKAKKLRARGRFPAIVYGADKEPVSLDLDIRETENVLARIHGEKILVELTYGDSKDKVFVRNVQRDPVIEKLLHVDFFRVDLSREMDTKVPVIGVGTSAGVKLGGLLTHMTHELEIRCLPGNVPPHIEVSVESLEIGQSIHVRDLAEITGVKFLTNPDAVLFSVAETAKAESDASAEPAKA